MGQANNLEAAMNKFIRTRENIHRFCGDGKAERVAMVESSFDWDENGPRLRDIIQKMKMVMYSKEMGVLDSS